MIVIARYLLLVSLTLILSFQSFADDILWESGQNIFIKLVPQDESKSGKTPPNSHPVELVEKDIAEAMELIKIWTKDYYEGKDLDRVFHINISRLIGEHTAKGLKQAKPNQDIIYTLAGKKRGSLGAQDVRYQTGRVFYLDGKLNIILGEYDHPGDKLREMVYAGGNEKVTYHFPKARRAKASKKFKDNVVKIDGIENVKIGKKTRKDWFAIDLKKTKKEIAKSNKNKNKKQSDDELKKSLDDAKLAKERREMRLEMARIRQEMKQNKNATRGKSVEERLQNLKSLKEKGLVSDDEYETKRKEILNDI